MTVNCASCGNSFETKSSKATYCGAKCRKAAFRSRAAAQIVSFQASGERPVVSGTVGAARAELEVAGRLETYLGQSALALAERIDSATAVMGFAALVKELRSTMDAALVGAARAPDLVDELEERRERKFAGA